MSGVHFLFDLSDLHSCFQPQKEKEIELLRCPHSILALRSVFLYVLKVSLLAEIGGRAGEFVIFPFAVAFGCSGIVSVCCACDAGNNAKGCSQFHFKEPSGVMGSTSQLDI